MSWDALDEIDYLPKGLIGLPPRTLMYGVDSDYVHVLPLL